MKDFMSYELVGIEYVINNLIKNMKKYLFLAVMATTIVACGNGELEELYNQYEVSVDNKEKKNPNFLIFKDRTQTGKEGTK